MNPIDFMDKTSEVGLVVAVVSVVLFLLVVTVVAITKILKNTSNQTAFLIESLLQKSNCMLHTNRGSADMAEVHMKAIKSLENACLVCHSALKADRVAIYVLHNGVVSLSGFPFLKKTCLSEWVSLPIIRRRAFKERDLGVSGVTATIYESYIEGDSELTHVEDLAAINPVAYAYFKQEGIKSYAAAPIRDLEGRVLGYVISEWIAKEAPELPDCEISKQLSLLADRAQTILQFSSFEDLKEKLEEIQE